MNDDRLASELQRRASGAPPRPDWAQRDLLPAVWREIDARPQRVLASRWSPLAGVATLVVALLVLAVAVPRLGPQPPSATSTPASPLVLTTADFASRLAAGELDSQSVLVDGTVSTPSPDIVPNCPPGGTDVYVSCGVGLILDGTDIRIGARPLAVEHADYPQGSVIGPTAWPWWDSTWAVGTGILVLKVPSDGGPANWAEFLGRIRKSGQGLTWSATDVAALDINSLGHDEVVLVDGWLGGFTYARCLDMQFPPLEGLPTRECSGERIASEAESEGQPVVGVQPGAYADFAPNPTSQNQHEARHATYAVAPRLEGWCGGAEPPCWQWTVVARLDANVGVAPTPSPTPSPPVSHLSVSEFAARFTSGELNGRTVVVDGQIGPDTRWGPLCGPFQETATRCYLGPLEGTDPVIDVYAHWTQTTEADGGASTTGMRWNWWHFLSTSGEGPLLLAVPSAGQVDFLGTVRSDGSGETWSATAVAGLDIPTIGLDEIRLVDAWLTGEKDLAARCAWQPRVDVLPSRGDCSYPAWLTDHPDVTGFTVDDLAVQGRAYESYSPTPGQFDADGKTAVPQRGVYAVARRLYGDGCGELPPCWGWSIIARVDVAPLAQPSPIPTLVPPPTPTVSPTAAIGCEWYGWSDPQATDGSPAPTPSLLLPPPVFIDETGLVASCASSDRPWDNFPMPVIDAVSDLGTRYRINWTTTVCDTASTVTFARVGDRFTIEINRGTTEHCDVISHRTIAIELREPVDYRLIDLASPTPLEPGSREFRCVGSEALGDPGIMLVDHSGRIGACSMARAEETPEGAIGVVTTHLPGQLAVDWTVNSGCPADERMEFWGPTDEPIGLANYVVQLSRRQLPGQQCNDLVAVRRVELGFTVFVQPSDILPLVVDESATGVSVSHTTAAAAGVEFDLSISASQSEYSEGDAIEISSSLVPGSDVTVSCLWAPIISLEQLDGPLAFVPGPFIRSCPGPRELRSGEELTNGFMPAVRGDSEPNPLDPYIRDGKLYLPPGTYRFVSRSSLSVGANPNENPVRLEASIVIHVR